jgi:hypothetical protein
MKISADTFWREGGMEKEKRKIRCVKKGEKVKKGGTIKKRRKKNVEIKEKILFFRETKNIWFSAQNIHYVIP